ncbi:uncharacterized protein LOC117735513 isoform X2 [Cyclopterus lumpus]|uniref:uncharacterized protein LOC117735513 isoform X2 n=1 Tax=Cyclopterus lumpus TaxID=8103 RepID=UPI00148720DD|nr:uncharacterized protein LOC117735513 isoform X2 [Cyclopterus lumpus]
MKSTITSSFDVTQLAYEDPEEPVHFPIGEYSSDYKRPRPPRPPLSMSMISRKPTIDAGNPYTTSISEPTSPTERTPSPPPPRPQHPPPPSIASRSSTMKPQSETDESQQSSYSYFSFMPQSPVPPALSDEEVNLCKSGSTKAASGKERPAVPPRPGRSSLSSSASLFGTSPTKTRPPPPSFCPPPPPSSEELLDLDSAYSKIEHRPYLDVLPEDVDKLSLRKTTVVQSVYYSPYPQTSEDAEDINGMLRWLKRVSKSDLTSSVYGLSIEEEMRLFCQGAMNVRKALRLYNLLMMKRNESMRNIITEFSSISDNMDKMKKKSKTIDIAGGTTGAVGGMTAVLGIAFAPVTLGASLIATVIGAGMVASAGGIGAHAAKAKKEIVNRMTVEKLVYDYKANVVDLEHCLGFILGGMNEIQRHDIARLQRAGAQTDSVKMAHLSQFVLSNKINQNGGTSPAYTCGMSSERLLLAFANEMDLYFKGKDSQKLKKSSKSKFSGRVRLLAENLQEELHNLNRMWEMFS